MNQTAMAVVEIFISLVIETIILGGLFTYISSRTSKEQEQHLKSEMLKIENGLKFVRDDILNQIKESAKSGNK
jgi:hypothetical protein